MRVGCSLIGILMVTVILGVAAALTFSTLGGNPTTATTGIAALTSTTTRNTTAISSKEETAPTTASRRWHPEPSRRCGVPGRRINRRERSCGLQRDPRHPSHGSDSGAAEIGTFAVPLHHPHKSRLQDLHPLRCGDGGGSPIRSSRSLPRGRSLLKGVTADNPIGSRHH